MLIFIDKLNEQLHQDFVNIYNVTYDDLWKEHVYASIDFGKYASIEDCTNACRNNNPTVCCFFSFELSTRLCHLGDFTVTGQTPTLADSSWDVHCMNGTTLVHIEKVSSSNYVGYIWCPFHFKRTHI